MSDQMMKSELVQSGPAHHRIKAENPYIYGINVNSRIAVTLKVTPAVAATEWPSRGVQLAHDERPQPERRD